MINFGADTYGDILFGFFDAAVFAFVPPDPTICTFQFQSVSFDALTPFELQVHKDIAMKNISKESHPQLYLDGH